MSLLEQYEQYEKKLPKEKVTIDLQTLWLIFNQCFPAEVGSGQTRNSLGILIRYLEKSGYRLPASKKLYDRSALPHLPKWIKRPVETKATSFAADKHLWAPELVFLGSRTHLANHETWLQIDQWLKKTALSRREQVPLRERSYEIFRDEKALDKLRTTKPFRNGLITLKNLACFAIYEPLPTEPGPPSAIGKPALIVENHTTHWTIANWNKSAGRYACVIYGGGNKVSAAAEWLIWKQNEFEYSEIRYFGDIDIIGLEIPIGLRQRVTALSDIPVNLETDLYQLALWLEEGNELPQSKGKKTTKMDILSEFPGLIAVKMSEIFANGERIPQETITHKDLVNYFNQ